MDFERIEIAEGDITRQQVDAIVNAANQTLLGGGGVDGAIHRAAGPELLEECRGIGGCPTGEARITGGYRLPAKHVIHTVGPVWSGGRDDDAKLAACYRNSLNLAREHELKSVAFPSISTGAYRFPLERATRIALTTTAMCLEDFCSDGRGEIDRVVFVCFGQEAEQTYRRVLEELRGAAP